MQRLLRPLVGLLFFTAIAYAQIHAQITAPSTSTRDTSEFINTLGLQGVIVYLTAKEWGPALMKKLRGGSQSTQVAGLDKADAVMEADIKNLIKNFDSHLLEDRASFGELRKDSTEVKESVGRIEGMLRVMQQNRR